MYVTRRLKPDTPWPGLAIPLTAITLFLALRVTGGEAMAFLALAVVMLGYAGYTLMGYARTRNTAILVVFFYQLFAGLMILTGPAAGRSGGSGALPMTRVLAVLTLGFMVWIVILAASKRGKWRGRDLLELAAQSVEETAVEGYTSRPRPVGKVDVTPRELRVFAEFVRRELIALPSYEQHRVVFVSVLTGREPGYVLGLRKNLDEETWVAIDDAGNVSVHIAKRDYLLYREDLAFDELCVSFGQVFIEFLTLFLQGKSVRITDQLNAMPVGIFS
ncbi:MAG: hypothetical protein MUQ30_19280 [Anaerolineae bacterium]|nr:hypothetical protein [Anaerolineae bacterium]